MRNPGTLYIKTLDGDWCDKDHVLLHACFQLLTDFVEQEKSKDIVDWTHSEDIANAEREIDDLYAWWKKRSEIELSSAELLSEKQYQEDNGRLIRLIKIRKFLWT